MRRGNRLPLARAAALVALGELAVHQLRYTVAFGGDAGSHLSAQGHSYLGLAAPLIAALALSGRVEGEAVSVQRGVALYAAAILAVFCVQELGEGAAFAGHPAGAAAVLAHGGLMAVPLSLALGLICAVLDRRLDVLERVAAALGTVRTIRRQAQAELGRAAGGHRRSLPPLAFGLARRPPPLPA